MTILGITGPTGGGKTSALKVLETLGALIIDCDAVYHDLIEHSMPLRTAIAERFDGVVKDGFFDRKALGRIVFNDKASLDALNAITHRFVLDEVSRRLDAAKNSGGTLAAIDAIALVESGLDKLCGIVIAVTAPAETRVRRIMARDGISEEYARMRVAAQPEDSFYAAHCNYVLKNDAETAAEFKNTCRIFFTGLLGGNIHA